MDRLVEKIRGAIGEGRLAVSTHASNSLDDRGLDKWAAIAASLEADWGEAISRPSSKPHPTVELPVLLPDGSSATLICAWVEVNERAKLVTFFLPD